MENISETDKKIGRKPFPVGISDFKSASCDYYYVDKTLLIRDFLDRRPQVSLFTRPLHFGKTLNMDMLRVFFEKTDEDNSKYFCDKDIWSCGSEYTDHQGKYPVIFLSFKDVKCTTWEDLYEMLTGLIKKEYLRHNELKDSMELNEFERERFVSITEGTAGSAEYQFSLQTLSMLLYKHYKKETVIIIDEYDIPIRWGYYFGFYREATGFLNNFFSAGLKDNSHLAYGFMAGLFCITAESVLSGLNNISVYSVMDETYSRYFGFTKEEVKEMLSYYDYPEKYDEACEWYGGYKIGDTEIFNPYSVISYVSNNCQKDVYWPLAKSNDFIGALISMAPDEIRKDFLSLVCGDSVFSFIDTDIFYPQLYSDPYSIYSFLLASGYLKTITKQLTYDGSYLCDVVIPNKEIFQIIKGLMLIT